MWYRKLKGTHFPISFTILCKGKCRYRHYIDVEENR